MILLERFVKEKDGIRPFQSEVLKTLENDNKEVISVEAPVGSGKSYIIRRMVEDESLAKKPIILCYPTKILMEAQVSSLVSELKDISIWPDLDFTKETNIFLYSTDNLVNYLLKKGIDIDLDRSKLIQTTIEQLFLSSGRNIIVTSPDVLFGILVGNWYKSSKRIQSYLKNAIVVFDEFHLYSTLENFTKLIKKLFENIAQKIILLSATPVYSNSLQKELFSIPIKEIMFKDSIGEKGDKIFNHQLDLKIHSFKYTDINLSVEKITNLLKTVPKPVAIIFDSVFRLKHVLNKLPENILKKYNIIQWHGIKKDVKKQLGKNDIILGTSSIEVGIDMNFKSLIFESRYWTSAIQRLGRVGRFEPGNVHFITKKNLIPSIENKEIWKRSDFEINVLMEALKEPEGEKATGNTFRGDSYNFLLHDTDFDEWYSYNEAIFSMFQIENAVNDWKEKSLKEKKELLFELGIKENKVKEILLRDKLIPFWGIVEGKLNNDYQNIITKYDHDNNSLEIIFQNTDFSFTFYGEE